MKQVRTKQRWMEVFLHLMLAGTIGWLGFPTESQGASITNIIATDNTPQVFDDIGTEAEEIVSTFTASSTSGISFASQYQSGTYTDVGGAGAVTNVTTMLADYTVTFEINVFAGAAWTLVIDSNRVGARTAVDDGAGQAAVTLGALTGTYVGPGVTSGSLDLAGLPRIQGAGGGDQGFNQSNQMTVNGVGTGANQLVTLTFNFSAIAESIDTGSDQGDEAGIRMGIPGSLSFQTVGDYPGPGARNPANDGHFVTAGFTVVPEPNTWVMLSFGFGGLAVMGSTKRQRRLRRAATRGVRKT